MTDIASFDVFDTTLTRLVGSPRQVFVETGRRLRANGTVAVEPEAFAAVRERALAQLSSDVSRHPALGRVMDEVASRLGLAPAASAVLVEAELAVEADVCRAVPGMPARLAEERRRTGRGVVLVSDTPTPTDALEALLRREGLFFDGDALYTSSGHGASKQHGGLFDIVARDQGASAGSFSHLGDDDEADVVNARLHGWQATLVTGARLTAAEERLDRHSATTEGLGGRLAGASRFGRLRAAVAADGSHDAEVAAIAAGTALPLLIGYGLWLLSQARLRSLRRLHFVARDGEIIRAVTQRLADARGDAVECRYLYGSRRVWQLAARGTKAHRTDALWLPDSVAGSERTADEILRLVGATADEAYALTGDPIVAPGQASRVLGADGFAALRALLERDPLQSHVRAAALERRDVMLRYLDAQQVTADGEAGIVDVGWTGRATQALEDVLSDAGRPLPAAHLFIGLLEDAPDVMSADLFARSHGWLVAEPTGRRLPLGPDEDTVMLIETFTMGSEGSTSGYAEVEGVVTPQLAATSNPATSAWSFGDYRAALGFALDAFVDGYHPSVDVDLRPVVSEQIVALWRHPDAGQARAWGAQPYGEDFNNARWHPLATPLTTRRLLTRLGVGRPEWREPTYWIAGTIAISPPLWRTLLGAAYRVSGKLTRLRRIPGRLRREVARRRA